MNVPVNLNRKKFLKSSLAKIMCMVLLITFSLQVPIGGARAYAAVFQEVKLLVADDTLKVNISYVTGTSGQLHYVLTEDGAPSYTGSEIEGLATSGVGTLAHGSAAITYGGGPLELLIDISSQNFVIGKSYKLQTVLKEGGSFSSVMENRFFKGAMNQAPEIVKKLSKGFNVKFNAGVPGTVYLALQDFSQQNPTPTPDEIVQGSSNFFVATLKSGLSEGFDMILPLRAEELFMDRPYKIYYTFVDAYGSLHTASNGSAFSLTEETPLGNTADVMYYRVGDPADHTDDSILVKCATGIMNRGDVSQYTLVFHSTKGDITADPSEISLGSDGNSIFMFLNQSLVDKLYNTALFDGGTFSLSIANGGTIAPKFEYGYNTLTTPLPLSDLAASGTLFLGGLSYEDNSTVGQVDDDYIVLSLPGTVTSAGALVITVSENDIRGYSNTVKTLVQGTDFNVSLHSSTEVKITFDSTARTLLNQMNFPTLKISPAESQWNAMNLSLSGNSLLVHLPSTNAALSQATIDGRPVQDFNSSNLDYSNIPLSYLKYGPSMYLNSASYGRFITQKPNTPFTVNYDGGQQKLVVSVVSDSGLSETYRFAMAVNPLSLKSLKVNGQSVANFYGNLNYASATVPASVISPTIEALFENESITLAQLDLEQTGSLPGEKTYRYSLPDYPNISFTIRVATTNNHETPSNGNSGNGSNNANQPNVKDTISQIATRINTQAPATEIAAAVNNLGNVIESAQSEEQVYNAVYGLNESLGSLSNWLSNNQNSTPENLNQVSQQLSQLTGQVATGLERISYPVNAVQVAAPFVKALGEMRQQNQISQPRLDSQVEALLTRLSDRLGTVALPTPETNGNVLATPSLIEQAIDQQSRYLADVNAASQAYFTEGSRSIPTVVTLAVPSGSGLEPLQVQLPANLSTLIGGTGVDGIRVSGGLAGLTVPTSLFAGGEPTVMAIQPVTSGQNTLVGFEVLRNNAPIPNLGTPVTLSFNLNQFGLGGSDWHDLSIFRLDPASGQLTAVGGRINTLDGSISVQRGSLSQYTVMKSSKTFSDADQSWAKAEINAALNKGIVEASGKFEPKSAITRGEFASWVAKAYGLKASGKGIPFKDVPKTHQYYNEIAAVYEAGLIDGKTKNSFDPGGTLSANELAVILGKTLVKFDNKQTSEKVTSKHLATLKAADTASWAQSDMALLQELGFSTQKELAQLKGQVTKEVAAAAFMKAYQSS